MKKEIPLIRYLKRLLFPEADAPEMSMKEKKAYQNSCLRFLKLSGAQQRLLNQQNPTWREEISTDFYTYLSDPFRKKMFEKDPIKSIRHVKPQFLDKYFEPYRKNSLLYQIDKRLARAETKDQNDFPKNSSLTTEKVLSFLKENIAIRTPEESHPEEDVRQLIVLKLYSAESKYDHPLLSTEDLCTVRNLVHEHFNESPARKTLAEALTDLFPQDIYSGVAGSFSDLPPGVKKDESDKYSDALAPSRRLDPAYELLGKESAALLWDRTGFSDRFLLVEKLKAVKKTDKEIMECGAFHGAVVKRFSDCRKTLQKIFFQTLEDCDQKERQAILTALGELIMDFEQQYPWPSGKKE